MEIQRIGSYEIIERLGEGGMGVVFKARHTELGRTVALKVIREKYAGMEAHLERFKREAAVCAELRHPNIIKLYDYGEEDGTIYYAMELLNAVDLGEYRDEHDGRIPLGEVLHIGKAIASAFSYIHERGLVHRDIKPANVMIDGEKHVTVMDFGLVKPLQRTQLTQEGKAIGTPRYMSPEMFRAEKVDGRSDIFQLGILLYELATGRSPFEGKDIYTLARNVISSDPKPPSKLVKSLGRHFDRLVMNCLAKDKEDRYQDAAHFIADCERVRKRLPISPAHTTRAVPAVQPGDPAPAPQTSAMTSSSSPAVHRSGAHSSRPGPSPSGSGASQRVDARTLSNSSGSSGTLSGRFSVLSGQILDIATGRESRRYFFLGVPAAVLTAFLLFLGLRNILTGSGGPYSSRNIEIGYGIRAVSVSWKSEKSYCSRILVKSEDGSYSRRIDGEDGTTKCHRLIVNGLKPGGRYTLRIIYPDGGASITHPFTCSKEQGIRIVRSDFDWTSTDTVSALWETNVDCTSSVRYRVGPLSPYRKEPLLEKAGRIHGKQWTKLPFEKDLCDVTLEFDCLGAVQSISAGKIPGPSSALGSLERLLGSFDPVPLLERAAPVLRNYSCRKDEKGAIRYVQSLVQKEDALRAFEKRRRLIEAAFSGDAMSPFRLVRLYGALRKLALLDDLLDFNEFGPALDVEKCYSMVLKPETSREAPSGRFIPILSFSEKNSSFAPVDKNGAGLDKLALGALKAYQGFSNLEVHTIEDRVIDLDEFLPSCSPSPRLTVRARNFRPEFYLAVKINGRHVLELRNTSKSAPPTMWLGIHKKIEQDSPEYNKSVNFVSLHFPRELLHRGENRFEIRLRQLPGTRTVHFVQLRSLRLYPN